MKVLKLGKPASDLWIGQCSKCNSIVEACTSDLLKIIPGDYRSDNESFSWTPCPVCAASICFHKQEDRSGKQLLKELGR